MADPQLTETAKLLEQLQELEGEIAKAETRLHQLKTMHQQSRSPLRFWRKWLGVNRGKASASNTKSYHTNS